MTVPTSHLACISLSLALFGLSATADEQSWQMKQLFEPSPMQLAMEKSRSRVVIYDGLPETAVERAMEEQFDRIEHMMFIGIRPISPDGEVEVDDDCD